MILLLVDYLSLYLILFMPIHVNIIVEEIYLC